PRPPELSPWPLPFRGRYRARFTARPDGTPGSRTLLVHLSLPPPHGRSAVCGIAGFSLSLESTVDRTVATRALLAGIAERGADSVGFAYRGNDSKVTVHKQRTGASEFLDRIEVPLTATQLLVHVRDS